MEKRNKSILLTRSPEENSRMASLLSIKDYDLVECSLLQYKNSDFDYQILNQYNNIIITSKHAARLLKPASEIGYKNLFVVGSLSAEILAQKGHNIELIASNVNDLQSSLTQDLYEEMIYLSGDQISTDLPYLIRREVFYSVKYTNQLTSQQIARISKGIDYILLYSQNCAKTLVKLLLDANLLKYLEDSVLFLISSKLEKEVDSYFKKIIICQNPDQMLESMEYYDKHIGRNKKD